MSDYDLHEKPKGVRKYAQELTIAGSVLSVLVAMGVLIYFLPGGRSTLWSVSHVLGYIINVAVAFIAVGALFVLPWIAPVVFQKKIVQPLDEVIEPDQEISKLSHLFIALGFGSFIGGGGMLLLYHMVWQHQSARDLLEAFHGLNPAELPPALWMIYSAVVFIVMYGASNLDWEM